MSSSPSHVFVSYSSKDLEWALRVVRSLEARGIACWIARRDVQPGASWAGSIVRAIRGARAMVLVFSGNADNSEEIKKEVVLAGRSRVFLIPARIEDLVPADEEFEFHLSTRQWVDLFDDWECGIQRIAAQIRLVHAAMPADAGAASAPAPDRRSPETLRDRLVRLDIEGPELVRVPAGEFLMGANLGEEERAGIAERSRGRALPRTRVTIGEGFWLCRTPVTVGAFRRFVEETGYDTGGIANLWNGRTWVTAIGASWREPGFAHSDEHPVTCVSWDDALAYAYWLSRETGQHYAPPSEAVWEYCCRAGTTQARYWGEDWGEGHRYAVTAEGSATGTAPVATRQANAWGLHDMLGNVWEWTADWWNRTLNGIPLDGSVRIEGDPARRVVRGGSWINAAADVRAARRSGYVTGGRFNYLGFRLMRMA